MPAAPRPLDGRLPVTVLIELDERALTARLDACLLTDDELAAGPETWGALDDPWPAWVEDASLVG